MARIDWVQQRLENWARWRASMECGGLGYATQSAFLADTSGRDQPNEARIPIDDVEGSVTDQAVEALKLGHGHLHQTLRLYYLKGQGIKGTARTMRRAESTIKAQLERADHLLAEWFRARRQQKERDAEVLRQQLQAARSTRLDSMVLPDPPKRRRTLRLSSKGIR